MIDKQTPVTNILKLTKENWPQSYQGLSPEILRIYRVHDHLYQHLNQVLTAYNLQAADFGALETLRKQAVPYSLSPTELSTAMLFTSGGLTKVLKRITDAGLVQRINNPNDKRGKLVQLTEAGEQLINRIIVDLHTQEQKKLAILSKDEKHTLNKLLNKMLGIWE
ncbi:MarR family transcriptional regulator [Psychromonas sp. RZ22]|uniref:MarR family winged helix-turn-helix transcriptional regulator n=1 Tax=Psychromonas algarum TaxID=2555643 RepID=UPI0010676B61|nr:MarR family transcriptional regulator [Psychromonas sp. RZ22]TEW55307.1 MarR family transcriptional regulator [Psychromonas sp. RZ22]